MLFSTHADNEKVFRAIHSNHGKDIYDGRDRKWTFEYCDLVIRCRKLDKIIYDYDNAVVTSGSGGTLNSKIIDNRHMSYPIVTVIAITETNTKSISESYSFGGSKTSEIGASLEVSASSTFGVPAVGNVLTTKYEYVDCCCYRVQLRVQITINLLL